MFCGRNYASSKGTGHKSRAKLTDKFSQKVDKVTEAKTKEIMTV